MNIPFHVYTPARLPSYSYLFNLVACLFGQALWDAKLKLKKDDTPHAVSVGNNYMKTILLLVFFVFGNIAYSQDQPTETEKIAATAKIWGFLKYYHPNVSDGKFNWDEELFEILPKIKNTESKEQLSEVFFDWINRLGEVEECNKCGKNKRLKYFDKNFDLNWINNPLLFSDKLSEKLKFIESNRHQGKKYYVSSQMIDGNIKITNENEYKGLDWQNENMRLLTLFRYWNIIEYFFPYKYQTDTNWDVVLSNMIQKFLYPESETDFHLAMLELIISIDDSHASFRTLKTNLTFGYHFIPTKFEIIDNNAVFTGFYNDSLARIDDLQIGDIVTKVDTLTVESIFKNKIKYIHGSNIPRKKANTTFSIFNGSSDSVQIEFIRNNKTYSKSIKRYLFRDFKYNRDDETENFRILDGNIGYVNMGALKYMDVHSVMGAIKDTKAMIIDIRNYPNGTLGKVAKYISSNKNDFYKVIVPDLGYPGKFIWKKGVQCGKNGKLKYKGQVILLVNEKSQSLAEFTAMCLQTGDNVITIGSQTSGADGDVSSIPMVGSYKTKISGVGIFYPDNSETQRKGVRIDIEVRPTIQGIIEGKDEVLEKAIDLVNE